MNEAELLFTEVLGCDRMSLYLCRDTQLCREDRNRISAALKRRIKGEPLQYILGRADFMGLAFKVDPGVLIPRPETELLAETAIDYALGLRQQDLRILDMGTGSGCIAIALAKFLPHAEIDAAEISEKALAIAGENAQLNAVKVNFFPGDLFSGLLRLTGRRGGPYDLIVSNPPYIPSSEIEGLQPEVRYEPRLALDGGEDGLSFFRRIAEETPGYLKNHGLLILEIGFNQKGAVENIFQNSVNFEIIEVIKDYNHSDRVMVMRAI